VLDPGIGSGWTKVEARRRALRDIRARQFALCLNLHGGPTSSLMTWLSGARWKVGFEHFRRHRIYQILVPDARTILGQSTIHTAEHQASAFFYLGLPRQEIPPARLFVAPAHAAWWKEARASHGIPPECEYAQLHPTALYATKQWAPEDFARLGRWLERKAGLRVIYSCGPEESPVLDAVEKAAGQAIHRLTGPGLGQFAAVLASAQLFVGNDSGPAHMAAALGRPGVVIFGSSSSPIWRPWSPVGAWRVVQNSYDCNPCPGDRCYRFERPECILSVTFEQVRSAVEAVLTQSTPVRQ
jgi:heptosyltransferase-3